METLMPYRKIILHSIGAFLLAFSVIFIFYVGLPVDFDADHFNINVHGTLTKSYVDLIKLTLNPLTPAWFYPTYGTMEYLRPLQFLLMKIYFNLFNYSLIPFHVTAAIGCGLLAVIFFIFTFYCTRSFLLGWLSVLIYASFPSNFFMLISITSVDFQYYVSLLSITALSLFGLLTIGKFKKNMSFVYAVIGWIANTWLAIKLKSTEKVLPLIYLGFLFLRLRPILSYIKPLKVTILAMCIIGMMVLVIPIKPIEKWIPSQKQQEQTVSIKPSTVKDKEVFGFQWKNMLERTFFVPGGHFPFTSLFPSVSNPPRSFTENLGFFLGWFFWSSLLLALIYNLFQKKIWDQNSNKPEYSEHFFWLLLSWFGATIAGFANGHTVQDIRLLNFAYVPFIFLMFFIVGWLKRTFFQEQKKTWYYQTVFTGIALYTVIINIGILVLLVQHFGGIQDAIVRAEIDIHKSFYEKSPNAITLYEKHFDLANRAEVVDWFNLPSSWYEDVTKKIEKEKMIYFYTWDSKSKRLLMLREGGYKTDLWKAYDLFDARPLIFKILKILRPQTKRFLGEKMRDKILIYTVRKP